MMKIVTLGVCALALAGGGFAAGRFTAPPPETKDAKLPDGWVDLSGRSPMFQMMMRNEQFLSSLEASMTVGASAKGTPVKLPEGVPPWPKGMGLAVPGAKVRWIDADLVAGEALKASKDRWTVVNLWATWCAPCVEELPEFNALAGKLAGKGVNVFTVNADMQGKDTPQSVKAMFDARSYGNLAPVVGAGDARAAVLEAAGMSATGAMFPTTIIYAPGGKPFGLVTGGSEPGAWSTPEIIAFFLALGTKPAPG
jgi:thiol-disulfide isomerase/thioredoxin